MPDQPVNDAPPVGEEIHLPEPTILPFILAIAITIALIGVTTFWGITVLGAIVAVWCIVRWVRETREEVSHLPLEHE